MTVSKKFTIIFLLIIFAVSILLRFYKLGKVPNGLAPDEADMGYNALSILKTGKDVYGRTFPIFFQSLNDYKPGIPIYLSIPGIYLFGLSDFSIRFIPAIFGALTPLLFFFLGMLLYPKEKKLAFILSALFALAPWNIEISRAMAYYEEFTFFYLLILIFFLLAITKKKIFLIPAAILLGLSPYVYFASTIYLPIFLTVAFILYKNFFIKNLKTSLCSMIIIFILCLPLLSIYLNPQNRNRFNAISLFSPDITLPLSLSEISNDRNQGIPLSNIVHNRRVIYFSNLTSNYFNYFNFDYLFANAKNTRYFYVNYVGLFYMLEAPLFLFGAYKLITRRDKTDLLVLNLLLVGPLPAIITLGSPFPHRALLFIITVQIISAIGLTKFLENISWKNQLHKLTFAFLAVVFIFNFCLFLDQYFIQSPREFTSELDNSAWFSTVRETVPKVDTEKTKYDKVIFTWATPKLVPPVYFLFYNKIDPEVIQKKAAGWTNEPPSYRQIYAQVGNIEFRPINWDQDKNLKNTLLIGYPSEFPKNVQGIVDTTKLPDGSPHFLLVKPE